MDALKTIVMAEAGLGRAAKMVQTDAKRRIGAYQDAVGPFSAWGPLAESTEAQKEAAGYSRDQPLLREGDLRDSIVTEHNAMEAIIGSKMEIARYQEFGTDKIPPRPFIGPAGYENHEKIVKIIGSCAMVGFAGGSAIPAGLGYDAD